MEPRAPKTLVDRSADRNLTHRSLIVIGVTVATVTLLVLFWYIIDVLLLIFAAVLLAIILRAPADSIARRLSIPAGWSLAVVILLLLSTIGIGGWLFGRNVAEQMAQLMSGLPELIARLQQQLKEYDWAIRYLQPRELLNTNGQFVGQGLRVISTTFGALASIAIVLLMAVFFAAQPQLYVRGLLKLIPIPRRQRVHQVLMATEHILRRWMLGQLVLMVFVAVLTGIGLWLLDVQFALALAVLAGLLTFIPYAGPILAFIPAVLVALAASPILAGYVALLYVGVQLAEAPLEPIVQQRAVYIAPVVVLVAQVVLGILTGPLGVMLATPLTAAAVVGIRMLYVEDVLGDRSH